MLRKTTLLLSLLAFLSCHKAQKSTDIYWKGKIDGATVKAIVINNMEFNVGEPESTFDTTFRFIAKDLGEAIETVNIYVGYKDHTALGTTITGSEVLFKTVRLEDMYEGPDVYPQLDLNFTFAEVAEVLQMQWDNVVCKDQFLLRFEINIDSGLSLSTNTVSPCIIGGGSRHDSPFEYAINVVDPIPEDMFIGQYYYESVVDGHIGGTLGANRVVTLSKGHSNNTRRVGEGSRGLEPIYFTIACDGTIMGRHFYQPEAYWCPRPGEAVILGPDKAIAPIIPNDDSVIDLWLVEGYLGFDGLFDYGTLSTKVRFSKQ
jgi:hypothetical protein